MCADFTETIKLTLSPENETRSAAEKRYEEAKKEQPAATVAHLFQILLEPSLERALREQGAVLLRQCLSKVNDPEQVWSRIGAQAQADVKMKLLQLLEVETVPQVRRKVGDCVQQLGNALIDIQGDQRPTNAEAWPELMPMLLRVILDGSKDAGLRADCLWTVKEMALSVWKMMVGSGVAHTLQVLKQCMEDPSEAVRANVAALYIELVDALVSKEERRTFAPLAPAFCQVLAQLAGSAESEHLNSVLQALTSISDGVDCFKDSIATHLMPVLCGIAKNHKEEASRRYAMESVVSFAEGRPKVMVKTPQFVEQALEVCVVFIRDMGDDPKEWEAQNEDDEDDEDLHVFGKEVVDRLAKCMQKAELFDSMLEVLKAVITRLFQCPEWKDIVAGISVLAQIAEYIDDEATVLQMFNAIKLQLRATHPRVRFAAWGAVAQFAVDHSEAITTEAWVQQLMPEFLVAMDDSVDRVCLRGMEAFQHYGESVEREDLEPFVSPLMEKLGQKLQASLPFQKKAITFVAVLAGQMEDGFAAYYGPLMPLLKQIIQSTLHKVEERTLLGKCFECISLLAKAVGRAGFRADAEIIMQAMIQATQVPNRPANDPVKEYMMAASERICSTMKEDFLPFVPHILPGVLEMLTVTPKELNHETSDQLDDDAEVNLTLIQENGKVKVMIMNSSEMEDLQHAIECVHTFVTELGKAYAPFMAQTAQALLPAFEFSMGEEIRDMAYETWGELCKGARESGQTSMVMELVMEFLKRILPKFEVEEIDLQALKTRAEGVTSCLKKAGPGILSAEQVQGICTLVMKLLMASLKRREDALVARKKAVEDDEDFDEDEDEGLLRVALCETSGALMQHHPDVFIATGFQTYLEFVQRLLGPGVVQEDRKLALFLSCDFLDHLGSRITQHWPQFLPPLLNDIVNPAAELRQPACYGTSLAARDPAFAPMAAEVAAKLSEVVTQSRVRAKKKSEKPAQACADNALSALVEILMKHQATLAGQEANLWNVWRSGLPCQEDEQEGQKNHKILLQLVQQERVEVVGAGGSDFGKVLAILVDVYKTDMTDEETSKGIGQLAVALGEAKLQPFAGQLTEKQRKKLGRVVREASQGQ